MATPHHLPKRRGSLKSTPKISLFLRGNFSVSHSTRFTWSKHFADGHSLWERLDRGMANNPWFMKFLDSIVNHLYCNSLDHCPLLINLLGFERPPHKRPFRFEKMWLSDEKMYENRGSFMVLYTRRNK